MWLAEIYLLGVIVGLIATQGGVVTRLVMALLWPLGPLAFIITATGLLVVAAIAHEARENLKSPRRARRTRSNKVHFSSPFPPDECIRRISSVTQRDSVFAEWRRPAAVVAKVRDHRFRLRYQRPFFHNPSAPILYGEVEPNGSGADVYADFRIHPFTKWFFVAWFALLGTITALGVVLGKRDPGPTLLMILASLGMAAFGASLLFFGRRVIGAGDQERIMAVLREALQYASRPS